MSVYLVERAAVVGADGFVFEEADEARGVVEEVGVLEEAARVAEGVDDADHLNEQIGCQRMYGESEVG